MAPEILLAQFEKLINFSKDQLTKKVLEIEKDLQINKNYDLLLRIDKSLKQYTSKKSGLVYIGFMGHFSSGKSSTINSLLNLSSKNAREVDLHPSDKGISLITHPENEASFIKLVSYGNIPVKPVMVESELLKNIVLIDTPGAGDTDPLLISELMQDYLPVCDLLLYFFNATNPIDKSDLPLLVSKQENLSFIQTKYIFSRGDEFRIDFDESISEANFDKLKSERFLSVSIERLQQLNSSIKLNEGDFFIIDNRKLFRIDSLLDFIRAFSSVENLDNQLKLHTYKLEFYRKTGKLIKAVFQNHIQQKLTVLKKYVEDANFNIIKYEDKVRITNNRLSQTWKNYQAEIQRITSKNITDLVEGNQITYASTVWQLPKISKHLTEINSFYSPEESITSYVFAAFQKTLSEIKPYFDELKRQVDSITLESHPTLNFDIAVIKVKDLSPIEIKLPSLTTSQLRNLKQEVIESLTEFYGKAKNNSNSLGHRLRNLQPIAELNEIITKGQEGLNVDIDVHFEHVYLYRAGVFSEHVKEYITNLGIGNRLNELEQEFDISFKEKIKRDTTQLIFKDFQLISANFKQKLTECKHEYELIDPRIGDIDFRELELEIIETNNEIKKFSSDLSGKIEDALTQKIRLKILETIKNIEAGISSKWNEYKENVRRLRNERIQRFLIYLSISIGFILLYWIIRKMKISDTAANNVILNIFSNYIIPLVVLVYGLLTDKFSKKVNKKRVQIKQELIASSMEYLESQIAEMKQTMDIKQLITDHFKRALTAQIDDIKKQAFSTKASNLFIKINEIQKKENEIRRKYIEELKYIDKVFESYFEYDDQKLDVISKEIKKEAIEPSFKFLEDLGLQISDVNNRISKIEF
ncbi:MAG: hypothetical protein ABJA78_19930 [Ferruginibacter sp.]